MGQLLEFKVNDFVVDRIYTFDVLNLEVNEIFLITAGNYEKHPYNRSHCQKQMFCLDGVPVKFCIL